MIALLTLPEAAERLAVSVATVRRLIESGALPAVRNRLHFRAYCPSIPPMPSQFRPGHYRRNPMNTLKENRTADFYRDAFTSASTWGVGIFEAECTSHGITPHDDEFFGHTADRLWNALSDAERAQFEGDYDDWLDA